MIHALMLGSALMMGQAENTKPDTPTTGLFQFLPNAEEPKEDTDISPFELPPLLVGQAAKDDKKPEADKKSAEKAPEQPPINITAPVKPAPPAPPPAPAAAAPDRWFLMKSLQGSWMGSLLDDNRFSMSGWMEGSMNVSTAEFSNQPVVWTDRANTPMLQQLWCRVERTVVTSGTTEPTYGFRCDLLYGTDFRFSIMRGIFNGQLMDAKLPDDDPANQILYGFDPIQFYVNAYYPTLFQGTEVRIGKHYCPFGVESLEAVSTPLMSRSYAFNWSPPFTHAGLMTLTTLNPNWAVQLMLVDGNDVWFVPAGELRFAGKLIWTSDSKRDIVSYGMSLGRGKFNTGNSLDPPTISLQDEPNGRNNINVFDLVYNHTFNPKFSYAMECIYGYQYGVPTVETALATTGRITGAILETNETHGTAHWGSIVNYLFYNFSPRWGTILRLECFDDFEGQRTGYDGLYTACTWGVQWKPRKSVWFRPEIRYDYNGHSKPFNPDETNTGRDHGLFFAGCDMIVRW